MKNLFSIAINIIEFTRKQFSSNIIFIISDQRNKIEIKSYLSNHSVKPEVIVYIYDSYYDVFIDTKHKITCQKCYCKAQVKDIIKSTISQFYSM